MTFGCVPGARRGAAGCVVCAAFVAIGAGGAWAGAPAVPWQSSIGGDWTLGALWQGGVPAGFGDTAFFGLGSVYEVGSTDSPLQAAGLEVENDDVTLDFGGGVLELGAFYDENKFDEDIYCLWLRTPAQGSVSRLTLRDAWVQDLSSAFHPDWVVEAGAELVIDGPGALAFTGNRGVSLHGTTRVLDGGKLSDVDGGEGFASTFVSGFVEVVGPGSRFVSGVIEVGNGGRIEVRDGGLVSADHWGLSSCSVLVEDSDLYLHDTLDVFEDSELVVRGGTVHIEVPTGTPITGSTVVVDGGWITGACWIGKGSTLRLEGEGAAVGEFEMSGASVLTDGGRLEGTGTVADELANASGVVSPGLSFGRLTIEGFFVQEPEGLLDIELGGTEPGVTHDVLDAFVLDLGGTLRVTLAPGFMPQYGDRFDILTGLVEKGSGFDAVEWPSLGGGLSFALDQGADIVSVVVVPGPGALGLGGCAMVLALVFRRRTTVGAPVG